MQIIPLLLKEFNQEVAITRKMFDRVPNDKFDYKPHEKSMTLEQLTSHLAELPGWIDMGMKTSEIDFSTTPYEPTPIKSTSALFELYDKTIQGAIAAMEDASEDDLLPTWTLRHGETVFMSLTKYELIRHTIAQNIHHRAQLGVYLRLLNIPLPKTYGPTADEGSF